MPKEIRTDDEVGGDAEPKPVGVHYVVGGISAFYHWCLREHFAPAAVVEGRVVYVATYEQAGQIHLEDHDQVVTLDGAIPSVVEELRSHWDEPVPDHAPTPSHTVVVAGRAAQFWAWCEQSGTKIADVKSGRVVCVWTRGQANTVQITATTRIYCAEETAHNQSISRVLYARRRLLQEAALHGTTPFTRIVGDLSTKASLVVKAPWTIRKTSSPQQMDHEIGGPPTSRVPVVPADQAAVERVARQALGPGLWDSGSNEVIRQVWREYAVRMLDAAGDLGS